MVVWLNILLFFDLLIVYYWILLYSGYNLCVCIYNRFLLLSVSNKICTWGDLTTSCLWTNNLLIIFFSPSDIIFEDQVYLDSQNGTNQVDKFTHCLLVKCSIEVCEIYIIWICFCIFKVVAAKFLHIWYHYLKNSITVKIAISLYLYLFIFQIYSIMVFILCFYGIMMVLLQWQDRQKNWFLIVNV